MEGEVNKLIHLKIMGDKGAERAMESLAVILDMEVDMNISAVNMVSLFTIPDIIGSEDMVSLITPFTGAISGTVFCLVNPEGAKKLVSALLGDFPEEEQDEMLNEMQKSAIIEIGNIITSSFVDVWADTFAVELSYEPPAFKFDFGNAIIDNTLIDSAKTGDFVILYNSTLNVINIDINFTILVLPDPGNLQMVFDLFKIVPTET